MDISHLHELKALQYENSSLKQMYPKLDWIVSLLKRISKKLKDLSEAVAGRVVVSEV